MHEPIPDETERIAKEVVDAALTVHRALGPVYEACFCHELAKRGIRFQRQLDLPIVYGDEVVPTGLRLDVLVDDCVIVENQAKKKMIPLYDAQIITCLLKLTGKRVGFLINYNVSLLKDGISRFAN